MNFGFGGSGGGGQDVRKLRRAAVPNGRLEVPGTFVQTGSDAAIQLNAANDWIASRICPKTDWELSTLSAYITAVGTQGIYDLEIYDDGTARDTFATAWSDTLDADDDTLEDYSIRQVVTATDSGNTIQVTLEGHSTGSCAIDNAAIVEQSSDATGTEVPTELLFSAGSGITIAAGETETCDETTYTVEAGKTYLIVMDVSASNGNARIVAAGGEGTWTKAATNSYDTASGAGFAETADATYIAVSLEVATTGPAPGSSLATLKSSQDCGASADAWVRSTLTAYQLQRGKTYWIVAKGTAGDDFSMSTRRWNTTVGSMFPDEMNLSLYSTDGGTVWDLCTQNSKPALWNIVLNSSANHVPPLMYGRYNGKYIYLPGVGVREIPEAGISLACDVLTADTPYYVYGYDNSGALDLYPDTDGPVVNEGILVNPTYPTYRYLGMIYPKELQSGYQGPLDVMDSRLVLNHDNQIPKRLGKLMPYAISGDTVDNLLVTHWVAWGTSDTDYQFAFLSDGINLVQIRAKAPVHQKPVLAIGIDEKLPHRECTIPYEADSGDAYLTMSAELETVLASGYHDGYPLVTEWGGHGGIIYCDVTAGFLPTTETGRAQVLGRISC